MEFDDLIRQFVEDGSVKFGIFSGKSGIEYNCETDIRLSLTSFEKSKIVCEIIYQMVEKYDFEYDYFIGVPETGTLISSFLNAEKYKKSSSDFYYNYLRAVPKHRQENTDSAYTILPRKEGPIAILIEDDVVTGNTMISYLKDAKIAGIEITAVISIFGRRMYTEILKNKIKSEFGITYISLIDTEYIKRMIDNEK